jgi:hypothetical protein
MKPANAATSSKTSIHAGTPDPRLRLDTKTPPTSPEDADGESHVLFSLNLD